MSDPVTAALAAIDAAHRQDPEGRELGYAEAITGWVARLVPDASPALRLAARCQHLERWTLPRTAYPMDKVGYHAWRREQYRRQGARAKDLCLGAGVDAAIAERVERLVAKQLAKDPEGAALEDAACLVFLEREAPLFVAAHPDYTADKYVDILRKTARKMSPAGPGASPGRAPGGAADHRGPRLMVDLPGPMPGDAALVRAPR
jgi:tRNAThr (cytosine32-N3)-methyltransferase